MRILSWNVNGIKTLPFYHPWNALKEHEKIIDALKADIVCIQETKITRKLMGKDLAVMNEFDAFFSFLRPPAGRHGTAIFTRRSALVPVKAEEGLSSVLIPGSTANEGRIGGYPSFSDQDDWTHDDVVKLESEGRTTVIDCGMFVLINLYSPNLTNEDRLKFKNDFNVLIDTRVRNLIQLGREVIVVGDLNIVLHMNDTSEPHNISKDGDVSQFDAPQYRRWLQNFVGPSGPMIDIVRHLHPDRKGMYTCWDTKTEARKSNHGARIDYILITPGLRPWVKEADIQADVPGSDHCPIYVDFHDEIDIEGRGTVKLWDEMNPKRSGSDRDPAKQPEAPQFATRFYSEYSSKQKSINAYFTKGRVPSASASPSPIPPTASASSPSSVQPASPASHSSNVPSAKALGKCLAVPELEPPPPPPPGGQQKLSGFFKPPPQPKPAKKTKITKASTVKVSKAKTKESTSCTPLVASASTSTPPAASEAIELLSSSSEDEPTPSSSSTTTTNSTSTRARFCAAESPSEVFDPSDLEAAYEAANATTTQWNSIFATKAAPLCDVHQEPARLWTVNKSGINKGRRFYLCASGMLICGAFVMLCRPVGPGYDNGKRPKSSVNPEWRCDFYQWETQVKRPAGIALDRAGKKAKS
ncbi:BQ5605_C002g01747 [Microbotryum silenes-dioicae]|uniref:DNA-(apurinic or apyrimidinic site) endonuclease n=1 Tax=Microbotryum silenes-dioicae TaxID=796604 RepID=A0A2X0MUF1_9BASI|nr:BQ5605_C002g01747 [Microbotryum silenes-dioicae]